MTASPVKFLFGFLFASIILWLIFIFSARLVAWILSRVLRASVEFRVGGWKCLRDVVVRFKKGAVESVSVGEIRISLRQSLVKLGVGFISKDPKLQVLICDLEVVMRTSPKSTPKAKSAKPQKARNPGKGKWMVVANMARFLSVSVTDLILKTSKATTEIKGLRVDISKDGGSKPTLVVKLNLLPVVVLVGEPRVSCDQSSICNSAECIKAQSSMPLMEKTSAPFSCDEFSLLCEFGYDSDVGIVIKNVEMTTGEVSVNLSEDFLLKNKKLSEKEDATGTPANTETAKKLQKKQQSLASISKYTSMIPEKVYFNLPKLDVRFLHREHDLLLENNITGVQLKSIKSRSSEDIGDSNRLDIQLDFSEIHLLRESGTSLLGIQKVDVVSFVYVPLQLALPIRVEMDVKLGGTQCNIMMSRLQSWMRLKMSKKKKMVLLEETSHKKPQSSEPKLIMWTCTVSAPEMTVALHDFNGLPLYQACSQSSHVFANNISKNGPAVHLELGELNLHLADEYQECMKESLFGVETNLGALMHIAKVTLDWGKRDIEVRDEDGPRIILALSIDVTGMGVYLTFKRVESIVSTASSVKAFLKSISASTNKTQYRGGRLSKPSGKGIRLLKFNLERCSVSFSGDAGVENTVVMDPKHFNYGSQGGKVVIRQSAHGTPRTADIISTISDESKRLKYTMSLDIFHLNLSMNKDKQSTHLELERARAIHQEYSVDQRPVTKVVLFDMQNAKFVRHSGGLKEIAACSLFSATDITVRWEPDVHISLFELMLQLKLAVHNRKLQGLGNEHLEETFSKTDIDQNKEGNLEPGVSNKRQKKKESIFAVDVEMLNITAEAGDGVDVVVQVQSIFSENARIGVLLEGLILDINGCRLFRSSRMQISRIPHTSSSSDGRQSTSIATVWDWVIQGIDVHICMPYRLQLRAIDDSVEEMLRALRLITSAKTKILFPMKTESSKPKKPSSTKLGCVRFCMRKLTADIEEEPIQGWLDEHYQLLKNEACELAVRSKFLDEKVCLGNECLEAAETKDSINENKVHHNGIEINMKDSSAFSKPQEEMYKMSFRSYYEACQKLSVSEGSGACRTGFQSGFKASSARTSLLSISATDLDLSLTPIEGEDDGIIEILKRLDPVCLEKNIPFSKLYGCNILLNTVSSLAVQLRNYTYPLFSATSGTCQGRLILAQQATCFQPQVQRDVFIGKWRKVRILRSAMGTTPPMKTYFDLPLSFQKAEVGFGVGFEPAFADISYAFTVALRRANLSVREPGILATPSKKEKSLPWWDDMRNYIHGNITLQFNETIWHILATTDPYEKLDKLTITSSFMELQQSDSQVYVSMKDFKIVLSSLESLVNRQSLKIPIDRSCAFLEAPSFTLDVSMEWGCASGSPMNHYLFALPVEGKSREIVFDPFRSTSLSLRFDFSLRPTFHSCDESTSSTAGDNSLLEQNVNATPTFHMAAHDVAWLTKFWNLNYLPPHKLRTFSRWARFGVPRVARSGNLSLDRVLTEFMLRIDATPVCIRHLPLDSDDPAKGLTFKMTKLKVETCQSRGKQNFTFECKRETLDLVYQGIDLHMPKINLDKEENKSTPVYIQMARASQSGSTDRLSCDKGNNISGCTERHRDDGFFLSSDYFTIRRQAPKADAARLLAWQEAGRRNLEMTYVRSEFENASDSDEHTRSEPSDDDGYNVVIADNCQRVFVYGLKLLWTIENRNAVWSFVGGISKAFRPPVPSPSRQYAQRRLHESQKLDGDEKNKKSVPVTLSSSQGANSSSPHEVGSAGSQSSTSSSIAMVSTSSTSNSVGVASTSSALAAKNGDMGDHEEGTLHFMVNVIEPQFNLHSEDANGRFLLAANSGRVLARSFHSVLQVGVEVIEQLGTGAVHIPESRPEMMWKRMELSVMLKQVQAHVAPTDVDPGAGLQWLPKMSRSSPKVNRTGALLERVFMPCDMYFRYTRHKGGTADLKVKPLKELTFNSQNIIATMTSRQFQVMLDVLTNLLFARLPKPRKSSLSYPTDDDEDVEEEADEVVPDGVEEVELARVTLEQKEREQRLLLADIRKLSVSSGPSSDLNPDKEGDLWMIAGGRSTLVCALKKELLNAKKIRKEASAQLRTSLQKAAQLRLMEKEKNKAPSYAMRISLQIKKVVWAMLVDGKPFAESEINDMRYDFDRDYKDVGVVQFMTKSFVVRNCLPNAKSDMLLSAWNPPADWGKKMMLCVDAKQGAPKDGHSPLELFQVEIYPLKIHLTETMYRTMWEYFFPEEEQDSQRRQEVWKVSTTAGLKRVKKGSLVNETVASSSHATKESEVSKPSTGTSIVSSSLFTSLTTHHADGAQASKAQNLKENLISGSTPELRRTSSFDRTWEENVAESVANELVLQVHSSSKCGPLSSAEQQDDPSKNKLKDSKPVKSGRSSHEEKKTVKAQDEKRSRPRRLMEFHNIKISQVELLVTYEGSRFVVNELKLLMDTFHRPEFTGTWRRLFSRVKKHIIWGVLKSVTGMQGKKFKDKVRNQRELGGSGVPDSDLNFSDNEGQTEKLDQNPIHFLKRPSDGAGDGFVTSVKGLFNTQRRKAKKFVLRTMRGDGENDVHGEWTVSDVESSPLARQLTMTKAKRLIRRHTKKFRSRQKGSSSQQRESLPNSPRETTAFESDSLLGSDPYEDFPEFHRPL